MYLANDVIQNSKKKGPEYGKEFHKVLRKAFVHIGDVCRKDDRTVGSLGRILKIWEDRGVYDEKTIEEYRAELNQDTVKAPTENGTTAEGVTAAATATGAADADKKKSTNGERHRSSSSHRDRSRSSDRKRHRSSKAGDEAATAAANVSADGGATFVLSPRVPAGEFLLNIRPFSIAIFEHFRLQWKHQIHQSSSKPYLHWRIQHRAM